jgi:hypothetical protein
MPTIEEQYKEIARVASGEIAPVQNDDTLNFVFITDPHHRTGGNMLRAARTIQEAASRLKLDFVLCGGDISINDTKCEVLAAQEEMIRELSTPGTPLLTVKGNHDDNSIYDYEQHSGGAEHVVYPEEWRSIALDPISDIASFDKDHPSSLYYYMDFPRKKTRVIVLDCTDHPYVRKENGELKYLGQWHYVFSPAQLAWLAGVALDLADRPDWRVLISSHVPILQDGVRGTDHAVRNDHALWGIIKAFREGGTFASEGGEGAFAYRVQAEFASQGPRTVIACLFGHVHVDQVLYKDGIPMISTLNACTNRDFPECPARRKGTLSETAFDIITVDFNISQLKAYRIGAGEHRSVQFG